MLPHFSRRSLCAQEFVEAVRSGHGGVVIEEIQALDGNDDGFGDVIAAIRVGEDSHVLGAGEVAQHHLYDRHLCQAQQRLSLIHI